MKPNEIKALLLQRDITIKGLGLALNENPDAISAVINYLRKNQRLRQKIADYLHMPVSKLFSKKTEVAPAKFRSRAA